MFTTLLALVCFPCLSVFGFRHGRWACLIQLLIPHTLDSSASRGISTPDGWPHAASSSVYPCGSQGHETRSCSEGKFLCLMCKKFSVYLDSSAPTCLPCSSVNDSPGRMNAILTSLLRPPHAGFPSCSYLFLVTVWIPTRKKNQVTLLGFS